ncbi:MAG TPA: hypothetical protein ENJ19_08115 [Gammaproteobacteria bacterium]|nr:hypothetical protein [Gammaproteobacteria bacterium]
MTHPAKSGDPPQRRNGLAWLTDADRTAHEAAVLAGDGLALPLVRRGTALAWVQPRHHAALTAPTALRRAWHQAEAIVLPGMAAAAITEHRSSIDSSLRLVEQILEGQPPSALLGQAAYCRRLQRQFDVLGASEDEGDEQEIETLAFDAVAAGEVVGENLWLKVSWLSFEEDDASLRFRFSFGLAGYEDVAADPRRQGCAADLCEAVFPESAVVSANAGLRRFLEKILGLKPPAYVERIVYCNAPNGGAQFHQDVERGHLGVVFAQLHGRTGWLALPKMRLVSEIRHFVQNADETAWEGDLSKAARRLLRQRATNPHGLARWLDEADNDPLEGLLNRCPGFTRQLLDRGHGYILYPGDLLLLPQHSVAQCTWHSVFCLDDAPGLALSFALREGEAP